jgi:hypothetical protein
MPYISKLEQANDGKHKWIAHFKDGRITRFGASGYQDYTQHHDKSRREAYRKRHHKDLDIDDPYRAGYLSWYILWNFPTIQASVKDFNKRFGSE